MVVNELVSLRIQNKSKVGLFPTLFLVSMFLLISCGGGDGETDSDCDKAFNSSTGEWECIGDSYSGSDNSVSSNLASASPSIQPTAVPTPVISNETEAGRELWVFLTKCVSIDVAHLEINTATKGDWLVKPTSNSPQEFGTWLIKPSGDLIPHNGKAGLWDSYIKGNCDTSFMSPSATDVQNEVGAATALWTQLAKCHPELPVNMLIAQKSQQTGDWVVVSDPSYSMDDYGVWSVERDATIKPLNERAEEVWAALSLSSDEGGASDPTETAAGCSPVIRNLEEAKDRMYAFLSSCFPELSQSEMKTNRDTIRHVWLVVTDEPYADNTSERKKSIWSVDGEGRIQARNSSAKATMAIVDAGNC